MGVQERLISGFSNLKFLWRYDMPDALSGLIDDCTVYINGHKTYEHQTETIAEEIGHAETSTGDITHYNQGDSGAQEYRARRWGMNQLVTLDGLISVYESCDWDDPADALGVSDKYLHDGLQNIRDQLGEHFTYSGYDFDLSHGLSISEHPV